jgi:formylglycine-generating enzyme required for sulfatase activity
MTDYCMICNIFMSEMSIFQFEVITLNHKGKENNRYRSETQCYTEEISPGVILEMVSIPGGTFLMGSPTTEEGCNPSQTPQHRVTVKPFSLGKYPITQAQWKAVALLPQVNQDLNPQPANFSAPDRPVEQVSWYDAVEFCARLSQLTGKAYRLPSEAEWEYACRASTLTPFYFGETITTDLANYSGVDWEYNGKVCSKGAYGAGPLGGDRRETTPVGSFPGANQFGLYDLHGNVREWCADLWHDHYQGAPSQGNPWLTGGDSNKRVLRGGSWNVGPIKCRSAFRFKLSPDASLYDIGFRVAYN